MSAPVDRYTASSLAGSCKIKHPFRDTPFFVVPIVFLPSNSNPSPSPIFFASSSSFWVLSNHHHTHYPAPIFAAAFSFILSPDPFSIYLLTGRILHSLPNPTSPHSLFYFAQSNHKLTLSATSKSYCAIEQILRIFEQYIHSPSSRSQNNLPFDFEFNILVYILFLIYTRLLCIPQTIFSLR